jgi:hypothetical protein
LEDRNLFGKAIDVDKRGRHSSFSSSLDAALSSLVREDNSFFNVVAERWSEIFPSVAAKPGRYENGYIILYVRSAPVLYTLRPRLKMMERTLSSLPGAPKKICLRIEVHSR